MDYGHEQTDKELKALERKLTKEYKTALQGVQKKADDYFSKFAELDSKKLAEMKAGKITEAEYVRWRTNKMLMGKEYEKMVDTLAKDLTNANRIAMGMIDKSLPDVYALNYNYGGYEIAKGLNANTSFQLVDHNTVERLARDDPKLLPKPRVDIPKDLKWNQQKLKSALLQGVLQGDSIPHIADKLQGVTDMTRNAAIRNARTMTTGAENAGRIDSYHEAEEMGIQVQKQWISTLDNRTRDSHVLLDGEVVDTDDKFSNGLLYPGDPSGEPEEVYNCRCTLICKVNKRDYDMSHRASKLGDMSYEEWKASHTKHTWADDIKNILKSGTEIGEAEILKIGDRLSQEMAPLQQGLVDAQARRDDIYGQYKEAYSKVNDAGEAYDYWGDKVRQSGLDWNDACDKMPDDIKNSLASKLEKAGAPITIGDADTLNDVAEKIINSQNIVSDRCNALVDKYNAVAKTEIPKLQAEYAEALKSKIGEVRSMGIQDVELAGHFAGKSPMNKIVTKAYDYYPTDWVRSSVQASTLTTQKVSRGYYSHYSKKIAISGSTEASQLETAIHELGHRFERTQGLRDAEKVFYDRRTKGEELKWLGSGYGKSEVTRRDNFVSAYMGKDYGETAYELCSMGFEYAYTNPLKLAKDKDMQDWIFGLLLSK